MSDRVPLYVPSGMLHVFVYGTLRRGGANDINRLTPPPLFVGRARVRGRLYGMGSYPGLVLDSSAGWVEGEVYRIDSRLEPVLDGIEELYPQQRDEYAKRVIDVELLPAGEEAGEAPDGLPAAHAAARETRTGDGRAGARGDRPQPVRCLVYELNPRYAKGAMPLEPADWLLHAPFFTSR